MRKYFPNIDHDILLGVLKRTVGDEGALWLIEKIVKDNGFEQRGLPIGALTSQLFANAYLDVSITTSRTSSAFVSTSGIWMISSSCIPTSATFTISKHLSALFFGSG